MRKRLAISDWLVSRGSFTVQNIQLSKAGGEVGRIFNIVETLSTDNEIGHAFARMVGIRTDETDGVLRMPAFGLKIKFGTCKIRADR